jgi:hypothetical protein
LAELLSRWGFVLPKILQAASSGTGQFDGVLGEMVQFFSEDPDRARLLLREVLDRPGEMRTLVVRHVHPWVQLVADFIRKGQARGDLHAEVDPEAYAVNVIHLLISVVATRDLLKTLSEERAVKELVRIARAALFLHPGKANGTKKRGGYGQLSDR